MIHPKIESDHPRAHARHALLQDHFGNHEAWRGYICNASHSIVASAAGREFRPFKIMYSYAVYGYTKQTLETCGCTHHTIPCKLNEKAVAADTETICGFGMALHISPNFFLFWHQAFPEGESSHSSARGSIMISCQTDPFSSPMTGLLVNRSNKSLFITVLLFHHPPPLCSLLP